MVTEIYLIRHGKPVIDIDNQGRKLMYPPEAHLSEEGQDQIESLTKKLPKLDILYTSPFVRAKESARIIADLKGVKEVVEKKGLSDRYSLSSRGLLLADAISDNFEANPKDETINEVYSRAVNVFEEILKTEKGKRVGIVSHGDTIRFIIWKYVDKGSPLSKLPEEFSNRNYPLQGEAWSLVFDDLGELCGSKLITKDDNKAPGKRKN